MLSRYPINSSSSVAQAMELTVVNLANPTELNAYGTAVPDWKLCRTVGAGTDDSTLYRLDATSGATNAPYVVDSVTAGLKWVAVAGRYENSALTVNGALAALSSLTVSSTVTLTIPLPSTSGGTGVNNAGTITNASNTTITGGGTIALGGFTLTVPATGTAGLLGVANTWTLANTFSAQIYVRGASIGALGIATASDTTPESTTAWDSTKHVILAGPANSSTGVALAASLNQTSGASSFLALTPGVAWRTMNFMAGDHAWYTGGTSRLTLNSSGLLTSNNAILIQSSSGTPQLSLEQTGGGSASASMYFLAGSSGGSSYFGFRGAFNIGTASSVGGAITSLYTFSPTSLSILAGATGGLSIAATTGTTLTVSSTDGASIRTDGGMAIKDGITAPSATAGYAKIFVDTADGDLKIIFGDGTTKTIVTDT